MTPKRKYISKDIKIAALLLEREHLRGSPIPFEQAKLMTAAEICALYEWDHAWLHVFGGSIHPTNLTPRLVMEHREKTRKDRKIISKIRKAEKRERGEVKAKRRWPSRPFPGSRADKEARAAR